MVLRLNGDRIESDEMFLAMWPTSCSSPLQMASLGFVARFPEPLTNNGGPVFVKIT